MGTDRTPKVSYEAYFRTAGTEIDHSKPDESRATEHLRALRQVATDNGASPQRFDDQLQQIGWAAADAEPHDGPFPLLIFAPGRGAPAFQNTVLCEYLASHGFVVAATPSFGPGARSMPATVAGIEAQVADLAFVARLLEGAPNVDAGRLGLIGYSLGGTAVLVHAMRNEHIGAVAALDSNMMVKTGHQLARQVPGYAPQAIRSPTMLMIANGREWAERDTSFYDEVQGADAWMLRFNDFLHGDFASTIIRFILETRPDDIDRDIDRIRLGYALMCRYLANFFASALDVGDGSRSLIPALDGASDGIMTIEHRARSTR
ncbi:MAG TPA: alpha/beta fold hydrolase [Acidobacteriota bacterium]|nr:alpha/beta fold hydrolase [Acidobacteriota bacterium]